MKLLLVVPTFSVDRVADVVSLAHEAELAQLAPVAFCNSLASANALTGLVQTATAGRNIGFGPAINWVAAREAFDWLIVANDDIVVEPAALRDLRRATELAGDAPVIIGALVEGSPRVEPLPGIVDVLGRVSGLSVLTERFWRSRSERTLGAEQGDGGAAAEIRPGFGFPFALAAISRSAWDRVSGFDESLPLYFEDADLLQRAQDAGVRIIGTVVRFHHRGSATARSRFSSVLPVLAQSAIRYLALQRSVPMFVARLLVALAVVTRSVGEVTRRRNARLMIPTAFQALRACFSATPSPLPSWS